MNPWHDRKADRTSTPRSRIPASRRRRTFDAGPESPAAEDLVKGVSLRRDVNVRLAQPAGINATSDEGLWIAIRQTSRMTSFESYRLFIDRVLCHQACPDFDGDGDGNDEIAGLVRERSGPIARGAWACTPTASTRTTSSGWRPRPSC